MGAKRITSRGYSISLTGSGSSWQFSAAPMTPDLPILDRSTFVAAGLTEEQAFSDAKQRIDRLLDKLAPPTD